MKYPNFIQSLPLPASPLIRSVPIKSTKDIVFTNDGSDDINSKPQAYPPITMQLIMCDNTEAENLQQQLSDLFEYEDDIPYISENLPAIFAGKDSNWALTDVRISMCDINLGLTAKQQDGDDHAVIINLHLSDGTDSFFALFCCQERALLVQQLFNSACTYDRFIVYRFRDNKPTSVAVSVAAANEWQISDLS